MTSKKPETAVVEPPVQKVSQRIEPNSPIQSVFTVEYAQRVRELQALQQTDVSEFSKVAKKAGVKVEQGKSLDDLVAMIVMAEFEKDEKSVYVEGGSPADIAARFGSVQEEADGEKFQNWGDGRARVGKNGDKFRTNSNGQLING